MALLNFLWFSLICILCGQLSFISNLIYSMIRYVVVYDNDLRIIYDSLPTSFVALLCKRPLNYNNNHKN